MKKLEQIRCLLPRGIKAYLVGGCVRDTLLGLTPKDIDIEVFDISVDELENILSKHGKVSTVGKSFGIIKLTTYKDEFDFSLPRRDSKCGIGHKGFRVEIDSSLSIEEAASRRDFTINAMSIDIWSETLIDPFNGQNDLKSKILRHTSSSSFGEDPLRVLRGFQFSGRFNLDATKETINICKELFDEFTSLPKERIWSEFEKWATKSMVPSKGLKFLVDTNWIKHFPELNDIIGCPQDPEWHPEGDVFEHTCHVVDKTVGGNLVLTLAGLCHDLGKPETTKFIDGRLRSPGHTKPSSIKARSFLESIGCPNGIINQVENLVNEHMVHLQKVNTRTIKRLILRLGDASIEDLVSLIGADHNGRGSASTSWPESVIQIKDLAEEIGERISPIIMGRHLIDLGLNPGPHFGQILKSAFEAQLDGLFNSVEEGIEFLKKSGII